MIILSKFYANAFRKTQHLCQNPRVYFYDDAAKHRYTLDLSMRARLEFAAYCQYKKLNSARF